VNRAAKAVCVEPRHTHFDTPWPGCKDGYFPVTEAAHARLLFLPMLSDPVPKAAARILEAIRRGIGKVGN